jgi:Fe-S-cluster containining protein
MARSRARVDAALDDLYALLPRIDCRGRCVAACGPIAMSARERDRAVEALGGPITADPDSLTCSALAAGRCQIYARRPMICRLWGVAENMRCDWGCIPDRWLNAEDAAWLVAMAEQVGGNAGSREAWLGADRVRLDDLRAASTVSLLAAEDRKIRAAHDK